MRYYIGVTRHPIMAQSLLLLDVIRNKKHVKFIRLDAVPTIRGVSERFQVSIILVRVPILSSIYLGIGSSSVPGSLYAAEIFLAPSLSGAC